VLDRILTLPNLVTLARLCCLPVFLWLLFSRENRAAAAWLLGVLGMTDWVDGYLARRLGQTSNLGKAFDPVVDRLLFLVAGGGILVDGSIPAWYAGLVLGRELLVGTCVVLLMALGAARPEVTWWGKTGAFLLMITFPCFLGAESTLSYAEFLRWVAWGTGLPGLLISFYAAALYVPIYRNAFVEGRAARATS
jgi:cardiolipin synthase (CMP-forming)